LAVIAFIARKPEDALLQDGILLVPQRQREADVLVAVADTGNAVLVPAVSLGSGVIVGKKFPCRAVSAVVFAHRSPGALADVRSPALLVRLAVATFFQTPVFRRHLLGCIHLCLLETSAVATAGNGRQGRVPAQPGLH